jgi:hypothetical protein
MVRAPVYAIAGLVFLVLGADDFLLEGTGVALLFLPVAIAFEAAAAYRATRNLWRREAGLVRGCAIGALLVAPLVACMAAIGMIALLSPQQ